MNKSRAMLCTAVLLVVAFGGTAVAGTSVSFMAAGHTTEQSAVFGSYLVNLPDLGFDTAISVSNVLMSPEGANVAGGYNGYNKTGTLEIYLYQGGEMMMIETSMDSPGTGLTDGMLGPGETYTVLLSELVDGDFVGYAWIVGNFDAIAGTRTVVGLGFSQHGEMTPPVSHQGGGIRLTPASEAADSGSDDDDDDHDHE